MGKKSKSFDTVDSLNLNDIEPQKIFFLLHCGPLLSLRFYFYAIQIQCKIGI